MIGIKGRQLRLVSWILRERSGAVKKTCGFLRTAVGLLFISLLWMMISLVLVCAHKVAPSGGPEDKTPPEILGHFPAADSVGITNLEFIEIEFSEPIRQSTLLENYWMMPPLKNKIDIKWKGNEKVRFYLNDSLEQDQTYVFTLSPNVRDMHNNGLLKPFQLAFSSGSKLDRGSISGQVHADQKPRDVYIYAYLIEPETNLDSLIYTSPHYYTQVDANGVYRLDYLALEKYRLVALLDQDYNKVYTVESDFIGLPAMDIKLDSLQSHFANINFYLLQEDTTRPQIRHIDTLSNHQIAVTFSEKVLLDSTFRITLTDSLSGDPIRPLAWSFDQEKADLLQLFIADLPPAQKISLRLSGLTDLAGNRPKDKQLQGGFSNPYRTDTTSCRLVKILPAHGQKEVAFTASIVTNFSVPVDSHSYKKSLQVTDQDSLVIPGRYNFQNLLSPVFIPSVGFKSNSTCQIQLSLSTLKDWWQRSFQDTIIVQEFTTLDIDYLGEIAGTVTSSLSDTIQAIIEANPLRGDQVYRTVTRADQSYQLDLLPEGNYLTRSILDVNRNGKWDKGAAVSWEFSEPFFFKPDTIKIRKRWTTQGINFEFNFLENK